MSWSESAKNWLESTKKLNPFGSNWYESTRNMNLSERAKNWFGSSEKMNIISVSAENRYETAKNDIGRSKSWVEEEARAKGLISDEHRDLLIKGSEALLLVAAIGYKDGLGSACRYILISAASDDDCCEMAKNKLETSKSWVEEEIRTKGSSISAENIDLVIKAGGALLLAPAIGYYGGLASACGFILKCAASDDVCREMAKNRFEMSKSWVEMAKNRFEMSKSWVEMAKNGFEESKSWAEEKIRERGISDERRDLVVKGGGALLLAAAMGYYGGLGGACGSIFRGGGSDNGEKLMKAPGLPGEFIARAAFEANPRAYFRGLRGKHP